MGNAAPEDQWFLNKEQRRDCCSAVYYTNLQSIATQPVEVILHVHTTHMGSGIGRREFPTWPDQKRDKACSRIFFFFFYFLLNSKTKETCSDMSTVCCKSEVSYYYCCLRTLVLIIRGTADENIVLFGTLFKSIGIILK